ncbi:MAG: GTPase Era [Clostridia bacterium]|nr:GTPase Era [Clostridia bacterium]
MNKEFKSGFVSLVGRTNVGKSTLLNALAKEKIAITTNKTQTTRTAIKAIITNENHQIIITDTPGIHKPKNKLGETMIETAFSMITEVDCILFLIDATSTEIGRGDTRILEKIKEAGKPCILVINKIDLIKKEELAKVIALYSKEYNFTAVVPISAYKAKGTEELISEIEKILPVGPKYYEEDEYTDQTSRQLVEELIREKALKFLNEEVPHGIYVEVEKFAFRQTSKGEDIYDIEATIYCLRESHKGIIIGKGGTMLKKISTYARQDAENMLGTKVNLKVWVKVKEDWQEKDNIVNKFKLK